MNSIPSFFFFSIFQIQECFPLQSLRLLSSTQLILLFFPSYRKRPLSPPPKSSSGKGPGAGPAGTGMAPLGGKPGVPGSAFPGGAGGPGSGKPSNTLSRREELLKQLKAVEDAIARKRAKIPTK